MINLIILILSFAGWIYLFFTVIDYLGNKFFNVRILKSRKFSGETLLINLCLIFFILAGSIEMSIKGTDIIGISTYGPLGNLYLFLFTSLAWSPIMVPIIYFPLLIFLSLILKIYRCISKEPKKNKTFSMAGLLVAIFFVALGSGIIDFEEMFKETTCGKLGDPGECYYKLGIKTNDISFCEKIEEQSKYKFYALDCYYEIASNTKDFSLCKKVGRSRFQGCLKNTTKNSVITNVSANAIIESKSQFCIRTNNQKEADRCHYDFVKFYYEEVDLYFGFSCYSINNGMDVNTVCYYLGTSLSTAKDKEGKNRLAENFLKLCDNIVDENLQNKCYNFEKSR